MAVQYLKTLNFAALPREKQIEIKTIGRPMPRSNHSYKTVSFAYFYEKYPWLCRCDKTGDFYCFPCILYGSEQSDPVSLLENKNGSKLDAHARTAEHMLAYLQLALIETKTVPDDPELNKLLANVLDCMKMCGINEEALEIVLELKGLAKIPRSLCDDLSDCLLKAVRDEIKNEIKQVDFVSVLVEDVSDISCYDQAVVFRYVLKGVAVERFWGLTSDSKVVNTIKEALDNDARKLTAQIYNPKFYNMGYSHKQCMSVHYPPYGPEAVLAKASNQNAETRLFFARVKQISRYCPEEDLSTIGKNKHLLEDDLKKIRDTSTRYDDIITSDTILSYLNDPSFLSTLDLYSELLPHIETLHEETLLAIPSATDKFSEALQVMHSLKGKTICEVTHCNIVLGFSKMREFFCAQEVLNPQTWTSVNSAMICEACNLYAFLKIPAKQVTAELEVLHQNPIISNLSGPVELLKFLVDHDLKPVVPNLYTLAHLVMTAPVVAQDGKKLNSIRKALDICVGKKFQKVEAKVMLSVEKEFINDWHGFNKKVIETYNKATSFVECSSTSSEADQPSVAPTDPSTSSVPPTDPSTSSVQSQIPNLPNHVPVPFPIQCKIEPIDQDEATELPFGQVAGHGTEEEAKNFPVEPLQLGNIEIDPLAIGEEGCLEPAQVNRGFVFKSDEAVHQKPPRKRAKRTTPFKS